tara:strand:+ start:1519 stop:2268 length:750 start_codon:yes stop_codon:yes gene_type:complete
MAKISFGGGIANMQGSIGGVTMTRTKGGSAARQKVKPTSKNSPAQRKAQSTLANASAGWRGLDDEQREAWKTDASLNPRVGVCGQIVTLTGQQHYVAIQSIYNLYGDTPPEYPPEIDMVGFLPNIQDPAIGAVAAFFGNPDDFTFDITGLSMNVPLGSLAEEDLTFGLWASPPVSPGVTVSHKKMKFMVATTLISSDISTGYVDFGNTYVNVHGDVIGAAGKAVTISLRQYHSGAQSFPCGMKTIIVES